MEFKNGQKCLYLRNGIWFQCEIVSKAETPRMYLGESTLKPATLLDKPRESSEETPSYMTFERMLSEMKHFPVTFMNAEGCDNGV